MNIIRKSVLIGTVCICMMFILAPFSLAAGQGTGILQGTGGQGTMNQMQAPSYGGQAGNSASQAGGTGGQMQAPPSRDQTGSSDSQSGSNGSLIQGPPSGGMMQNQSSHAPSEGGEGFSGTGNMTIRQRPDSMAGNMTRSGGPGGMQGNMTRGQPPEDFAGNLTMTGGFGEFQGNMTMGQPPEGFEGTMTAPDMMGNSTMRNHGSGDMRFDNSTPMADRPSGDQGTASEQSLSGTASRSQGQQQSQDDVIADLISKLQALLSSKK